MKKFLSTVAVALSCIFCMQQAEAASPKEESEVQIITDVVKNGVRYVTAVPSSTVCSTQIDFEINVKNQTITKAKLTRGCPGNGQGVCRLMEGMTVEEAIKKVEGINCGGKGTSCPDQMAKVLKSLKW